MACAAHLVIAGLPSTVHKIYDTTVIINGMSICSVHPLRQLRRCRQQCTGWSKKSGDVDSNSRNKRVLGFKEQNTSWGLSMHAFRSDRVSMMHVLSEGLGRNSPTDKS